MIIKPLTIMAPRVTPTPGPGPEPPGPVTPIPGTATIYGYTYNTVQLGNKIWTCQNFGFNSVPSGWTRARSIHNTGDYYSGTLRTYTTYGLGNAGTAALSPASTTITFMGLSGLSKLPDLLSDGWRLPTRADWEDLFSKFNYNELRSTGGGWVTPGTNESYFNSDAAMGENRGGSIGTGTVWPDGIFRDSGWCNVKCFWSSTVENGNNLVAYITTDSNFNNGQLTGLYSYANEGYWGTNDSWLSVRLVKDAT